MWVSIYLDLREAKSSAASDSDASIRREEASSIQLLNRVYVLSVGVLNFSCYQDSSEASSPTQSSDEESEEVGKTP